MIPRHVYDSQGFWVAFVVNRDVFLREGDWFGTLSRECEIRDSQGSLIGLLDETDCLFFFDSKSSSPALSGTGTLGRESNHTAEP